MFRASDGMFRASSYPRPAIGRTALSFNGDARGVIASAHRSVEDGAMFAYCIETIQGVHCQGEAM
jgi:hypothetical protein